MLIRCWGARGSIPVSGKDFLAYGGDTTCMEIRSANDEIVIVDAGSGIRNLGKRLDQEGRRQLSLLITHGHWDHLMGFPFFLPIYDSRALIKIYGCNHEGDSVKNILSPTMKPPHFPVPYDDIKAGIDHEDFCGGNLRIDSMDIIPIPLSHPNQGVGYRFEERGKSFVFLTDNELNLRHEGGLEFADYVNFSKAADLLIHDSEYDPEEYVKKRGWGHSTYLDAMELAIAAGAKRFGLFHHNQDRSDDGVDALVAHCEEIVARRQVNLSCFAVRQGMELVL